MDFELIENFVLIAGLIGIPAFAVLIPIVFFKFTLKYDNMFPEAPLLLTKGFPIIGKLMRGFLYAAFIVFPSRPNHSYYGETFKSYNFRKEASAVDVFISVIAITITIILAVTFIVFVIAKYVLGYTF